jgi:AcrR family transcriptional regulator
MPAAGTSTESNVRRQAIMAAAIDCFAQKGFRSRTTREITERGGISQPYLYRQYPNKQAMWAAVDHVSVVMTEPWSRTLRSGWPGGVRRGADEPLMPMDVSS